MYLYFQQIEELLQVIDKNQVVCIEGGNFITSEDIYRLLGHGVDYKKLRVKGDKTIFNEFNFGMLADSLKAAEENNFNYEQLFEFVKNGRYIPLTSKEIFINEKVQNLNLFELLGFKDEVVAKVIIEGVVNKRTTRQIASDIGHKTGHWNLDNSISFIQNILEEEAKVFEIKKKNPNSDPLVYKRVFEGACAQYCANLYLTNGIKSKPKIYKLSELEANGVNGSISPVQWKPTLRPTFLNCSCCLHEVRHGFLWNSETQSFSLPDPDYAKNTNRPLIRVLINGKEHYL